MTRKQQQRRSAIVAELSRLSRNGWANARREDWEPLERELHQLDQATSVQCPHCKFGVMPSVLAQHIREKH
jgi:hypothetical protein